MSRGKISTIDINYFPINKDTKILDLGCGDGSKSIDFSKIFAEQGISILAADKDNSGLRVLRDRIGKNNLKNIRILKLKADNKSLPLKNSLFDRVILSEVLEHIKDIDSMIAEIYRVLKPNGLLCLSIPTNYSEKFYYFFNPLYLKKAGHIHIFTEREIIFLLNKYKFSISKIKKENFVFALFWLIASILKINPSSNGKAEKDIWLFNFYFKIWGLIHALGLSESLTSIGNKIFPKSLYFYAKKN